MNTRNITIDGIGFNPDAVLKMGKDVFINHPMHNDFWLHLKSKDRPAAIQNAWEIINSMYGKPDTIIGEIDAVNKPVTGNSGSKRKANKPAVS